MENDHKLCLAPPESGIGPVKGGFIDPDDTNKGHPKDIFGYAEFGGRLANIVRNVQTPLVLALTGEWGSGKSVFAKQWAGELQKSEGAPVIYFDAFANDYQNDAFFALAGEMVGALEKCGAGTEELKSKAVVAGKALLSAATNTFVHWATGGATDAKEIAAGVKNALTARLESTADNSAALDNFRIELENAAKKIDKGQPLVFIVDELDRCRPDFALELLEKIKHLFSVPGVCFLVVTNLDEFKDVVRRAYGYNKKGARTYLDKFFHHVFWLPQIKGELRQHPVYVRHLWKTMNLPYGGQEKEDFIVWLTKLAEKYNFLLRDIDRVFANVALACAAMPKAREVTEYLIFALAGLCAMRKVKPDMYRKAQAGSLTAQEFKEFTGHEDWGGKLGNLPDIISILTGEISQDDLKIDHPLRRIESINMPYLTGFMEEFEVRS